MHISFVFLNDSGKVKALWGIRWRDDNEKETHLTGKVLLSNIYKRKQFQLAESHLSSYSLSGSPNKFKIIFPGGWKCESRNTFYLLSKFQSGTNTENHKCIEL